MAIIFLIILISAILVVGYLVYRNLKPATSLTSANFEKFRINRIIKRGGMATVYEAIDLLNRRRVALKIIHDDFLDDQDLVSKFILEGKILELLQEKYPDAPIVKIYRYSSKGLLSNFKPFLALELIDAEDLDSLMKEKTFSIQDSTFIINEVAKALSCAHKEEIWHRDVSPGNIMVGLENKQIRFVKVIDFGVARHEYLSKHTPDGSIHGKPPFMSPEQCKSEKIDGRSDIYALGVLYYTLVSGHVPFESKNPLEVMEMHTCKPVPPLPESIPQTISQVIYRMLEKDRTQRYQSMEVVLNELSEIIKDYGVLINSEAEQPVEVENKPEPPKQEDKKNKKDKAVLSLNSLFRKKAEIVFGGIAIIIVLIIAFLPEGTKHQNSDQKSENKLIATQEIQTEIAPEIKKESDVHPEEITTASKKELPAVLQPKIIADNEIKFSSIDVYESENKQLNILNSGKGELRVSEIIVDGNNSSDFLITGNLKYPIRIAGNKSHELSLKFQPTGSGQRQASLIIKNNDKDFIVSLSGNAAASENAADDMYRRGSNQYENGKYGLAADILSEVIAVKPNHALAYFLRGACKMQQNSFKDAISDFLLVMKYRELIPLDKRQEVQCKCGYNIALGYTKLFSNAKKAEEKIKYKKLAMARWEDFEYNCNLGSVYSINAKHYMEILK